MKGQLLQVTAELATPICGDVPLLDSLLELLMWGRAGGAQRLRRSDPLPAEPVHIPILRRRIGGVLVACSSAPIYRVERDGREFLAKRLAVENAIDLEARERKVVAVGNATLKSYYMPLHVRQIARVVWLCLGTRRAILSLLRSTDAIGRKRSVGYGRVARWSAEYRPELADVSWFAPSPQGPVLMRPLPYCAELPAGLLGARRDFGACTGPMWHPANYRELVVPC